MLGLVQLEGLLPGVAGLVVLAEGGVGLAEAVQDVGFAVGVAEVAEQGEGLLVVVQGLGVLAGVVGDVAQAVQRVRLAIAVVVAAAQGQGGLAVGAGLLVAAQPGRVPAHRVEHVGFPHRLVEGLVQVQGAGGVLQRPLIIPPLFPGPCESRWVWAWARRSPVSSGQDQGLAEVVQRVGVPAHVGAGIAEEPVR